MLFVFYNICCEVSLSGPVYDVSLAERRAATLSSTEVASGESNNGGIGTNKYGNGSWAELDRGRLGIERLEVLLKLPKAKRNTSYFQDTTK